MVTKRKTKYQESKNHVFVTIMITLVVAAITLLLVFLLLKKIQPNTEKINIINLINCYSCKSANIPETDNDSNSSDSSSSPSQPDSPNQPGSQDSSDEGDFSVFDNEKTWTNVSPLNIFEDSLYDNRSLIAPHSTNTYEFVVRNKLGFTIDYNLAFTECNDDKINMKYRLTHAGKYLAGNETEWVTFDKLNQVAKTLKNGSDDVYFLEWKWFDSDNDTAIGEMDYADYKLNIKVTAIQKTNDN